MVSPPPQQLGLQYIGYRKRDESAAALPYLVGSVDLETGQVFGISESGAILGRASAADIRITSNGVAESHARITRHESGESLVVQDLGSGSGTRSSRGNDGELMLLSVGDVLTVAGRFDFEVVTLPLEGTAA